MYIGCLAEGDLQSLNFDYAFKIKVKQLIKQMDKTDSE